MREDWLWITEYVRPWLATAGILITNGIGLKFYIAWQKGKTDTANVALAQDKLDLEGDKAIRDHYADELKSLREQIQKSGDGHAMRYAAAEERHQLAMQKADERFNAAQAAADERERGCEAKVAALRATVAALTEEVQGLRALMGQTGRSAIVLATNRPSLQVQEAADRAATALGNLDEGLRTIPHTKDPE